MPPFPPSVFLSQCFFQFPLILLYLYQLHLHYPPLVQFYIDCYYNIAPLLALPHSVWLLSSLQSLSSVLWTTDGQLIPPTDSGIETKLLGGDRKWSNSLNVDLWETETDKRRDKWMSSEAIYYRWKPENTQTKPEPHISSWLDSTHIYTQRAYMLTPKILCPRLTWWH